MEQRQAHMCYGGGCEHESHMMAEGGDANSGTQRFNNERGVNKPFDGENSGMSLAGLAVRSGGKTGKNLAKYEHEKTLQEQRRLPKPDLMADGGEADSEEMHPMIKKLMMSRGGMVANDDEPEADSMPAEFDDLALDDHLEGENSGAADGDGLGDAQEDDDRHDIVSRIMKSRSKKDRMPRPA